MHSKIKAFGNNSYSMNTCTTSSNQSNRVMQPTLVIRMDRPFWAFYLLTLILKPWLPDSFFLQRKRDLDWHFLFCLPSPWQPLEVTYKAGFQG